LRRILITALVGGVAALGFAAVSAGVASADPTCFAGGHSAGPITVNGSFSPNGSGYGQVCIEGVPASGTVTAAGSGTTQSGYIVADGNDANPGALGGYVGVSSGESGIVACSNGDFNNEAYTGVPSSGDPDTGTIEGSSTDNDSNNQFLPLPTDPNFQTDLQNDLAALQANSGPCAVPPPAVP
jgi:hypothetical protein